LKRLKETVAKIQEREEQENKIRDAMETLMNVSFACFGIDKSANVD
jgi:hypothetical protein